MQLHPHFERHVTMEDTAASKLPLAAALAGRFPRPGHSNTQVLGILVRCQARYAACRDLNRHANVAVGPIGQHIRALAAVKRTHDEGFVHGGRLPGTTVCPPLVTAPPFWTLPVVFLYRRSHKAPVSLSMHISLPRSCIVQHR